MSTLGSHGRWKRPARAASRVGLVACVWRATHLLRVMHVMLVVSVASGALARCAAEDSPPTPASPAAAHSGTEGSFARIELTAAHRWTPPRGEPESHLNLFAVFVQHLGLVEEVARAHVGLAADSPPLGRGECRLLERSPSPSPSPSAVTSGALGLAGVSGSEGEDALVELLDAGALWVILPQQSTLVRPTLYPDVLPHVSGVEYRATLSTEGLSLGQVGIQGFGGADVGTFEWLRREGPSDFRIQQVAGSAPAEAPFAVRATAALTLRWSSVGAHSQVRIRLLWDAGPAAQVLGLECRPTGLTSHVFLPADLAKVSAGPAGRDISLEVVASRRESLRLPDGTPATFLLAHSDSVLLTVTP